MLAGDARRLPLRNESVQCVVTSPPYWGLRKYAGEQECIWGDDADCQHEWASKARGVPSFTAQRGTCVKCGAWRGAYGLEPTVEMYVEHTVEILREIRRVLRDDGVCFWNVGDTYSSGDKNGAWNRHDKKAKVRSNFEGAPNRYPQFGLKPKDLCLIPMRVALAAQADGWWVRSVIIWAKPNPMPESCRDRPTGAYEYILMLTKSARYYWDADAVAEKIAESTVTRVALAEGRKAEAQADKQSTGNGGRAKRCDTARVSRDTYADERDHLVVAPKGGCRNLRNVWTFPTQPYSGAHFAAFPEELPRRCILAATSAKGACAQCGKAWERVTCSEMKPHPNWCSKTNDAKQFNAEANEYGEGSRLGVSLETQTIGWRPGCGCGGIAPDDVEPPDYSQWPEAVPCVVLDPFAGSGTTGRVAIELGRTPVMVDIAYGHPEGYAALAAKRTARVQREINW